MELEVQVRLRAFRVAAVAHVRDELPGLHLAAHRDAGCEAPARGVLTVVGAGRVVVDVDVPVLPAVITDEREHVARRSGVVHVRPRNGPVVRGDLVHQLGAEEIIAFVVTGAALAAVAEVVGVVNGAVDGEGDAVVLRAVGRPFGPGGGARGDDQTRHGQRGGGDAYERG
jgi:hypothetical protein